MAKIQINELQKLIREELIRHFIFEGEQEDAAAEHTKDAAALLKSLEKYQTSVSSKAKAEFGDNLDQMEKILKRIVGSPLQYVDPVASVDMSAPSGNNESSDDILRSDGPKAKTTKPAVVKKKSTDSNTL